LNDEKKEEWFDPTFRRYSVQNLKICVRRIRRCVTYASLVWIWVFVAFWRVVGFFFYTLRAPLVYILSQGQRLTLPRPKNEFQSLSLRKQFLSALFIFFATPNHGQNLWACTHASSSFFVSIAYSDTLKLLNDIHPSTQHSFNTHFNSCNM